MATDGDNAGAGTINDPWLTWDYGMEQLVAGDTLYIRGGIYLMPRTDGYGIMPILSGGAEGDASGLATSFLD